MRRRFHDDREGEAELLHQVLRDRLVAVRRRAADVGEAVERHDAGEHDRLHLSLLGLVGFEEAEGRRAEAPLDDGVDGRALRFYDGLHMVLLLVEAAPQRRGEDARDFLHLHRVEGVERVRLGCGQL